MENMEWIIVLGVIIGVFVGILLKQLHQIRTDLMKNQVDFDKSITDLKMNIKDYYEVKK